MTGTTDRGPDPVGRAPEDPSSPVGDAAVLPSFPVLDTLRAVGALAVLTTHAAFWGGDYTRHGPLGTVLSRLDVGVALFFVLSGFLLGYPHLARARSGMAAPRVAPYLWKRALRIVPVYLLTVVVALGLIGDNRPASIRTWAASLLMLDTFVHPALPAGLTHMWSLAVEVSFYLLLPLLMLVAVGRRRRLRGGRVLTLLLVMVAVSVLWQVVLVDPLARRVAGVPQEWLPGFLVWFVVGLGLALAHVQVAAGDRRRWHRPLQVLAALPGCCWAAAGGLLLVTATPLAGPSMLAPPSAGQALTKNLLYAAIAGLVVLPAVLGPTGGRFATLLSAPPLRHVGHISYGLFCLHLPVLHLVMAVTGYRLFEGHGVEIWALTLVLALAAAEVVHRYVERPAMRLRDARPWERQWRTRRRVVTSEQAASETSTQ